MRGLIFKLVLELIRKENLVIKQKFNLESTQISETEAPLSINR